MGKIAQRRKHDQSIPRAVLFPVRATTGRRYGLCNVVQGYSLTAWKAQGCVIYQIAAEGFFRVYLVKERAQRLTVEAHLFKLDAYSILVNLVLNQQDLLT